MSSGEVHKLSILNWTNWRQDFISFRNLKEGTDLWKTECENSESENNRLRCFFHSSNLLRLSLVLHLFHSATLQSKLEYISVGFLW